MGMEKKGEITFQLAAKTNQSLSYLELCVLKLQVHLYPSGYLPVNTDIGLIRTTGQLDR